VEQEYQVRDGVTSALELEWGVPMLRAWYESRASNALINYGASVNWAFCRSLDNPEMKSGVEEIEKRISGGQYKGVDIILDEVKPALYTELSADQLPGMLEHVKESLREGGVGIGLVPAYVTGSSREEIYRIYQLAGEMQVPIFTHVREGGTMAIQQSISDAVITSAPLHIVHVNSMARSEIGLALEMIQAAQQRGFDITTELYPYTAASTGIETALFDEGWQERLGISYNDLQWVATGERLTEKTFIEKRKEGGIVIVHMMKPDWIRTGIAADKVIISSDGMFYAKLAHPRTAGTFSRVLGKYVREEKVISLPTAIEKMTLLPAKRLETISPMMRFKGRIQVGADADITVFDPDKVIDRATFDEGLKFSEGIHYVLVNGVLVVNEGKTVKNVYPGQPIYGKFKKQ
jgi:dihydroorotase